VIVGVMLVCVERGGGGQEGEEDVGLDWLGLSLLLPLFQDRWTDRPINRSPR
jgi:hypothetical protein